MNGSIGAVAAFAAGVVSFLSPCVLPLIPAYISLVSGMSLEELRGEVDRRTVRRVVVRTVAFVAGFTVVFVLLGATATGLGSLLLKKLPLLSRIAGAVIILFGLHLTGLFRIKALYAEKRFAIGGRQIGPLGAFVAGLAFAFGWTPCIGPVLAGILAYAAQQETVWRGVGLLALYSLGLGIPFLLTGLGINRFFVFFGRIKKWFGAIEVASGVVLIGVGVLIFTNRLTALTGAFGFLNDAVIKLEGWLTPGR